MEIQKPLIQVAGVHDIPEAELIAATRANMIGFPLRLGFHQPDCSESVAADIIKTLPPSLLPVVICYCNTARETIELLDILGIKAVQLHGEIPIQEIASLRRMRPDAYLIKSLVIGQQQSDEELLRLVADSQAYVDCYITDTFDPQTGATGATGKTHDWQVSARLARASTRPLILAGGLTPDNVAAAIRTVRPAGVDVHTGVEGPDKRKDAALVQKFVDEARRAFSESDN